MINKSRTLKKGFSTGTAVTAAIVAALKVIGGEKAPSSVAIWIPAGFYLVIPVKIMGHRKNSFVEAEVIKDGGDDPDVTHKATIRVIVALMEASNKKEEGIWLEAGEGVGIVTKPGLPVPVGEPAINPIPRQMIRDNVIRFFLRSSRLGSLRTFSVESRNPLESSNRFVFLPFNEYINYGITLYAKISIPDGDKLALRTLNPRLGIVGGLSILGTTGLVKPFSHEAYEETINYALRFAKTNNCKTAVLSTGGKSEKYAKEILKELPESSFVQIADFFEFSLQKAQSYGFEEVIHAVFLGKAIKMALGYGYTHAHFSSMDINRLVESIDTPPEMVETIRSANTAMEILEILKKTDNLQLVRSIALRALMQSFQKAPGISARRLVLFDYDGKILSDLHI